MKAKLIQIIRAGFAALALTAIFVQLDRHVSFGFSTINFFSYFTNLSNIFFALFLMTSATTGLLHKKPSPLMDAVRGATILAMLVVGIVFSLLLRNEDLGALLPWVNFVLHYLMPLIALVDWLLVPTATKPGRWHIVFWLFWPLVYLIYTLIRGAYTGWYPYPFLNPDKVGSNVGVGLYCVGILVLFALLSWVLIWARNLQPKRVRK